MASKYDSETRERVLRMYGERRSEAPQESLRSTLRRVHELVGIPIDTIRGWVARAEIEAGKRPGLTSSESADIKALKRELAELRRANEILKTASAFFAAAELDRKIK